MIYTVAAGVAGMAGAAGGLLAQTTGFASLDVLSGITPQYWTFWIGLACEPRLLLLDEPVAGVPAGEREELLQTVAAFPADVSVLLIEHDMDLVFSFANRITREEGLSASIVEQHPQAILSISDTAVVLYHGTVMHSGPPEACKNSQNC